MIDIKKLKEILYEYGFVCHHDKDACGECKEFWKEIDKLFAKEVVGE